MGRTEIRGSHIKDDSLTGSDIDESTLRIDVKDVNSSYEILNTDYLIRCIQGSGITLTLPTKSNNSGKIIIIKDVLGRAGTHSITIAAAGSDTIDGSGTFVVNVNYRSVTIICDGINGWMITSVV